MNIEKNKDVKTHKEEVMALLRSPVSIYVRSNSFLSEVFKTDIAPRN